MGVGGSRQGTPGGGTVVYVDEVAKCLEEKLQRKYERGMRGVLPSLTSAVCIFVALQQSAVEMCAAISLKLKACSEGSDAYQDGVKEASVKKISTAVDSIVVTVEELGRDMPSCLR